MSNYSDIPQILTFIERHGYALLFLWILAEQSAVPIPSAPLLLGVGALIRAGRLQLLPAMFCCVLAALAADTMWFELGRRRGRQVLRLVCRLSLEPDSCVRQTETAFLKYGMRSLLVSKFIPGLNAVAAPLAGNSSVSYSSFAAYDIAGVVIWSGAYFLAGYAFSEQLQTIVGYTSRMGSNLGLLIVGLLGIWIGSKLIQRWWSLRQLKVARITPLELRERLAAGEEVFIVDLRSALAGEEPFIPGALRISPKDLAAQAREIPRDREVIVACT